MKRLVQESSRKSRNHLSAPFAWLFSCLLDCGPLLGHFFLTSGPTLASQACPCPSQPNTVPLQPASHAEVEASPATAKLRAPGQEQLKLKCQLETPTSQRQWVNCTLASRTRNHHSHSTPACLTDCKKLCGASWLGPARRGVASASSRSSRHAPSTRMPSQNKRERLSRRRE